MGLIEAKTRERVGRAGAAALGLDMSPELAATLYDYDSEGNEPRVTLTTGGQQAGKSIREGLRVWNEIDTKVPRFRRSPEDPWRYWFVLPSYRSPPTELDYLAAWSKATGRRESYSRSESAPSRLVMMGGRVVVETRSGQNPEQIASYPCDGVCIVEAGQQPEAVLTASYGRLTTRHGWLSLSGTLEDVENHTRWEWYEKLAQEWQTHPKGSGERMYTLPTWANRTVYPGGEHDPEIEWLRSQYDEYTFARRVAAIPTGAQNPAYPALQPPTAFDHYCREMPEGLRWVGGFGGMDFGLGTSAQSGHISTVVAVTLASNREAWVRACRVITTGDPKELLEAKAEFTAKFGCYQWGADPMQTWAAKFHNLSPEEGIHIAPMEAVSGAAGSRDARVGFVRRRLNNHTLFFDMNGEGVIDLVREMVGVRYVVNSAGQLVLRRIRDDRTSALEDATEVMDLSEQGIPLLAGWQEQTFKDNTPPPPQAGKLPERERRSREAEGSSFGGLTGTSGRSW